MKKLKEHNWILLILLLSFLVRFIGVPNYPTGFTQDEAGIGYDAYSILKTGKDQWGEVFPLTLRSFGDFKLPLYSYLSVPTVFLFGLNEFAVRLPGVLLGSLSVLMTYLMVHKLTKSKKISLWSALLMSLSPWHLPLSRGAFEANLTTFFMPLGIYAFYKGLKQRKWMVISMFSFGLNLFSYHSARLLTPLVMIGLLYFERKSFSSGDSKLTKDIVKAINRFKWPLLIFLFFLLLVMKTMVSGANSRAFDVTIFNPTDGWHAMSEKRFYTIISGLDSNIARLFVNKVFFVYEQFINNYFKYISPQFLFTEGVSDWNYGMIPGRGVLYLFEVITILAAFIGVVKNKGNKNIKLIIIWIILSPIPAALTKGGGAAGTRAAVMMPALQVMSAYGLIYLIKSLRSSYKHVFRKNILEIFTLFILFISFTNFLVNYVYYYPTQAAESMQAGRGEMAKYVEEVGKNYQRIRVSRSLGVPHIWVMFHQKWDPSEVQQNAKGWLAYDDGEKVSIDQYDGYTLGKYIFGNIYYENRFNEENTLFVGRPEDFPRDVRPLKVINDQREKSSVYIVESIE